MEKITKIINGSGIAEQIRLELKEKIDHSRVQPGLAVILVGQDPASRIYVDFKKKASREVGIYLETHELPFDVTQKYLLKLIDRLNKNKKIHGILVQLPLPEHIEDIEVLEHINPSKDVDGFHPHNVGLLSVGFPQFIPATARGIMYLLDDIHFDVAGKEAVVIGASNIVGKPVAQLLLNAGATVTVCHIKTKDLSMYTQKADLIVTAVGKPNLLTQDMVKEGVVVIDAGISRVEDSVVGDVDFEHVKPKVSNITPVPGGVGPMTVACLLQNTWDAMRRIEGYEVED